MAQLKICILHRKPCGNRRRSNSSPSGEEQNEDIIKVQHSLEVALSFPFNLRLRM